VLISQLILVLLAGLVLRPGGDSRRRELR